MLFVAPSVNDSGCSVAGGARVDSEVGEFASPFSPRPLLAVSRGKLVAMLSDTVSMGRVSAS
jgi:hypothetical protein